ncbi:MAG: class I SAM-dependent methyltransferase [Myxococcota bacterium]
MRVIDHYGDGDWYDAEYVHIRADLALYRAVATEARGPVLELACGTGRISYPMAQAGATVVGVDLAPAMLARARRRLGQVPPDVAGRLRWVEGDMRTLRLEQAFDRVVLGFNSLLHMLEDDDLLAVLETARTHLAPGGRFCFDIFSPSSGPPERDPEGRYDPQQMIGPDGRRWIVSENNRYDPRRQINHMRFYYRRADAPDGEELMAEIPLRVIYPRELELFLRQAGLEIAAEYDDYARTRPYTAQGLRVVEAQVR